MSETPSGKVACFSGGSDEIGCATAPELTGAGNDVAILFCNNHEKAEAVCEEIRLMAIGHNSLADGGYAATG
ncbi:MAG: hypothetical protein AAGC68_15905 [Verrucomicrobiota bacterium]